MYTDRTMQPEILNRNEKETIKAIDQTCNCEFRYIIYRMNCLCFKAIGRLFLTACGNRNLDGYTLTASQIGQLNNVHIAPDFGSDVAHIASY